MALLHIGCSSRGGPGSTIIAGRPGTTRPGAVPTGSITCDPAGIMACLRLAARMESKLAGSIAGFRPISFLRMLAILFSSSSSSTSSRPQ
ncbi:Uncharacterised protein [Mycobacterium tuberculosis]|uniref:Uncharacterized protein n=1 Tax=Mycobacterium tuberculosis TaxID=1773 RepID=A0A654TYL1_MYCTX|nr:Uncharacterised protein [Mycobacterium tuberculosis]